MNRRLGLAVTMIGACTSLRKGDAFAVLRRGRTGVLSILELIFRLASSLGRRVCLNSFNADCAVIRVTSDSMSEMELWVVAEDHVGTNVASSPPRKSHAEGFDLLEPPEVLAMTWCGRRSAGRVSASPRRPDRRENVSISSRVTSRIARS